MNVKKNSGLRRAAPVSFQDNTDGYDWQEELLSQTNKEHCWLLSFLCSFFPFLLSFLPFFHYSLLPSYCDITDVTDEPK